MLIRRLRVIIPLFVQSRSGTNWLASYTKLKSSMPIRVTVATRYIKVVQTPRRISYPSFLSYLVHLRPILIK